MSHWFVLRLYPILLGVKKVRARILKNLRGFMTVEPFYAFSVRLFRSKEWGWKQEKGWNRVGKRGKFLLHHFNDREKVFWRRWLLKLRPGQQHHFLINQKFLIEFHLTSNFICGYTHARKHFNFVLIPLAKCILQMCNILVRTLRNHNFCMIFHGHTTLMQSHDLGSPRDWTSKHVTELRECWYEIT